MLALAHCSAAHALRSAQQADMGFLVWDADAWKHALLQELQSVQTLAIADGSAVLRAPWDDIPPAERTQHQRLD